VKVIAALSVVINIVVVVLPFVVSHGGLREPATDGGD
jgi:hypothetical protein